MKVSPPSAAFVLALHRGSFCHSSLGRLCGTLLIGQREHRLFLPSLQGSPIKAADESKSQEDRVIFGPAGPCDNWSQQQTNSKANVLYMNTSNKDRRKEDRFLHFLLLDTQNKEENILFLVRRTSLQTRVKTWRSS